MCEILLCVHDMSADPHDAKTGDVVAVQPDGWAWGECELGGPTYTRSNYDRSNGKRIFIDYTLNVPITQHPNGNHKFWRVIKLPNVTVQAASRMLAPEQDVDPANPSPYLQYRAFYIDFKKLVTSYAALSAHIADDLRVNQSITLPYTATQINAVVSQRAPIAF